MFIFFALLFIGIHINTLKIADYKLEGLYIKLDKKLIVKAEHVIVPTIESDASATLPDMIKRMRYLFSFFQSVELPNIQLPKQTLSLAFTPEHLYINSDSYKVVSDFNLGEEQLNAQISQLDLKEQNLTLNGDLVYHIKEDTLVWNGRFSLYGADGVFDLSKVGDNIHFKLDSQSFTDLKSIIDQFHLEESVRSWVVEKIKAKSYQLLTLEGDALLKDGSVAVDFKTLKGDILFSEAEIHFKEELSPVLVSGFLLSYRDGGLFFDLKDPSYEGISLEGSEVSISHLMDINTNLKLKIRTNHPYDATLQNLVKAYDIQLPLDQKSGNIKLLFMADIGLKTSYEDFYVNVDFLEASDLALYKVNLPIAKGVVEYKKGLVLLHKVALKDEVYEGDLNGTITLDKHRADLVFDAKEINIAEDNKRFFRLSQEQIPFTLHYDKNVKVEIPKFGLKSTTEGNQTQIHLSNLKLFQPYLVDQDWLQQGGDAQITTQDFETYLFKGVLKRDTCVFYESGACKIRVPFEGKKSKDDLNFYAFDKRVHYKKSTNRIDIKNLNVDLVALIKGEDKKEQKSDTNKGDQKPLVIVGKESYLRYEDYNLLTQSYDVEVDKHNDVKAIGSTFGDIVKFSKKGTIFSISALRIQDEALHALLHFDGLEKGRYTLKLTGDPDKTMQGKIIVEGGVMKGFKIYNNTLALINTVPALASLQNPGYSTEGFRIEEGMAEVSVVKKNKIIFDSIYIRGTSATIAGVGEIDLEAKTIHLNLAIRTIRELGKVVGSIPLVGYILLGDDKSITFGLQVSGSLEDPQVNTSAGEEILTLPLKIIQRAIKSTGKIIPE